MKERIKIKRLNLPFALWDECSHDDEWHPIVTQHNEEIRDSLKDCKVIQPPLKVGTNGRYLTKCACWFECEGVAYEDDRDSFLHDLGLLEAAELSMDTYRALLTIQRLNETILSKKQKKLIALKSLQLNSLKVQQLNSRESLRILNLYQTN